MKERAAFALYDLLGLALLVLAIPALLSRKVREGFLLRLGRNTPAGGHPIWVHGASVGEMAAAESFVAALLERYPTVPVVLSAFTAAGLGQARRRFAPYGARVHCTLSPLDWNGLPARVLGKAGPRLFIVLETELWPRLFRALADMGCPLMIVNGRLSDRSFPRYRFLSRFFGPLLGKVSLVCARTGQDGERFRLLGVPAGRTRVVGNMKHDRLRGAKPPAKALEWLPAGGRPAVFVAGSLRGKEGTIIIDAFVELKKDHPDLRMLLAPRHPDRFDSSQLDRRGLDWIRWSAVDGSGRAVGKAVLLVDTLGELAELYSLGTVAFVGGTIDGGEGHNLLEPALCGVPVLFGPGHRAFAEEGKALVASGGGFIAGDRETIVARTARLLDNGEERERASAAARRTAGEFAGAVPQTLAAVAEVLGERVS